MNYNVYLLSIQDKINYEDFLNLKVKFEQLQNKEEISSNLAFLKLQNPIVPIIISIICGFFGLGFLAIDRFMIRDFALGFLRMAVSLLPCIVFFALAIDSDGDSEVFLGLGFISIFVGYVWWFVDLFLVYKKAKQKNYNKIVEFVFNCS